MFCCPSSRVLLVRAGHVIQSVLQVEYLEDRTVPAGQLVVGVGGMAFAERPGGFAPPDDGDRG